MFHRLLALPDDVRDRYDVSSLEGIVHGAAPCPVDVKRRMIEWFGPVMLRVLLGDRGRRHRRRQRARGCSKPGTVGPADPGAPRYVGDDDGARLPAGEEGLVWIGPPARRRFEYFGDDAKTASTFRGDHFTLGDVG